MSACEADLLTSRVLFAVAVLILAVGVLRARHACARVAGVLACAAKPVLAGDVIRVRADAQVRRIQVAGNGRGQCARAAVQAWLREAGVRIVHARGRCRAGRRCRRRCWALGGRLCVCDTRPAMLQSGRYCDVHKDSRDARMAEGTAAPRTLARVSERGAWAGTREHRFVSIANCRCGTRASVEARRRRAQV